MQTLHVFFFFLRNENALSGSFPRVCRDLLCDSHDKQFNCSNLLFVINNKFLLLKWNSYMPKRPSNVELYGFLVELYDPQVHQVVLERNDGNKNTHIFCPGKSSDHSLE